MGLDITMLHVIKMKVKLLQMKILEGSEFMLKITCFRCVTQKNLRVRGCLQVSEVLNLI